MTVGGPADTRELLGLSITKVAVGPMDNNAYLLRCTQTGELALIDAARAGGLGGPLDGPGAEGDAGQARHQGGGAGEGDFRAGQGAHLGQARGQRAAGPQAELPVAGREPVLAGGTVIPGPGDAHRAQDGGDRLRATARIHGLPAAAAPGARAGIPVILLIQHRLQHRRARGGQRRGHSLLQHAQPQAAAEHARGQAGEPAYLGGGDLLDPRRDVCSR